MDAVSQTIDPRDEVKKLQTLVRQLELQNAQLRSRQGNRSSPPIKPQTTNINCRRLSNNGDPLNSTLDDVDVIDLEDLDFADEDSWLFKSPKKLTDEEKSVSPYKWMRRDVEDPENTDLQTTKQALVNKLDDIARVRFRSLSHLHLPVKKNPLEGELISPQLKASLGFNRNIDTRTFTRPKKKRDVERDLKIPTSLPTMKSSPILESVSSSHSTEPPDTPEDDCQSTASDSSFSLSSFHRLADVVDVQALARMQEKSLRESSPVSSSRRGSGSSSIPSTTSPVLGCEGGISQSNPDSLDNIPPPSPSSDNNFASQCLVEKSKTANSGNFRRSLPNLNKSHNPVLRATGGVTSGLRQHYSESRLPHSTHIPSSQLSPSNSSRESSDRESREGTPVRKIRKDSLPLSLSSSAVRAQSPAPRSGIPVARRSGSPADTTTSRSHLPKPVQSRIQAPRTRPVLPLSTGHPSSNSSDDSWKDGCF